MPTSQQPHVTLRRLPAALLCLCLTLPGWAAGASDSATRYYEDAAARLARNDAAGAIIQAKNALQRDPEQLPAHLLLARALLKDGQAAAAEAEFEAALRLGVNPSEIALEYGQALMMFGNSEKLLERIKADGLPLRLRAEVLAMRATAQADRGDMRAAVAEVKLAREADPRALSPLLAEIDLALRSRDSARARQVLDTALGIAPGDARLLHLQAGLLQGAGDARGAMEAFNRAIAADPRMLDALVGRASLLIDLKRANEALPDLERAAALVPREPRVAYLKSLVYAQRGDTQASRAQLEDVVRLVDELPQEFVGRQPTLLMIGGLASQALGRGERARALLELYVRRMPGDAAGRKMLANIYLAAGETARVGDLLQPLISSGDADPQALTTLAALRMQQRRYRDAADALEAAARLTGNPGITAQMGFARIANMQPDIGLSALRSAFDKEPGQLNVATALSTLYLRRGDLRNALAVAEATTRRLPSDPAAHNLLGAVKGAARKPAEARAEYTQAITLAPGFLPAQLNLARLDLVEGRADAARQRLAALLKAHPTDVQVLTENARLELGAGRSADALALLEKAYALKPADPTVAQELLALYQKLGKPAPAVAVAKQLALSRPDDPLVLETLGRAHLAANNLADARSTFNTLSRLPGLEPGQLVAVGRLQLDAGAFREASASAEKALARNAGLVPAQILQIESEMALGDLNRADALLKSFATRSGNSAEALRLAGDLARALQQPRDAARLYRSAFDKAPSLALVLRGVEASFQAGEGDRAVSLLDTWLRTHPNDLTARSALAESHFRLGHLADARRLYEGVLVAEPANANVANNLAQILMALNDPGALNAAEAAYRLAPGDANVLDTVGWARARSGALDIGLKALREARLRAPESREIRYHLAWVLLRKGLRDEARAELQGALNSTNGSGYDIEIQNLRRELGV